MNEYLDISGFKEKEFTVFCGAGISWNSGLPLANELKQSILEKLSIHNKDIDEIMKSNLPFEAFMETISWNTDISKILDIFTDGEPNTNHILIARLAKKGYLRTIFTTNFDLLIEKALVEKEGLKEDVDFKRYYTEEHFSEIDLDNLDDKIRIFKIHGSVDNKESIRTTLKIVASRTLSDKRMNPIRYLFSNGEHKKVLILGYSCSDEFDVTPAIQSLEEDEKEIVFVEHSEKEEVEDIRIKDFKNPFKKFTGKRLKCNTDNFIKDLWDSFSETVGVYKPTKSRVNWETYIDDWAKGTKEEHPKYFTTALLLYEISHFKRAIEYCEKALDITKEIGNKAKEVVYLRNLGVTFYAIGDFKRAVDSHMKALEIAKAIGNKFEEEACNGNLGVTYCALRNFKRAVHYYEKALFIAKETGHKEGEAKCYIGMGDAYCMLGKDFKGGIQCYEKALETVKDIGDKADEAACYTGLGIAFGALGDSKSAIEFHKDSLKVWRAIGGKAEEGLCCINLGVIFHELRDFKSAIEYFLNAEKIFKEISHLNHLRAVYRNLAIAYKKIGDKKKAEDYKRKLSEIKILKEAGSGTSYNTV